MAGGAQIASRKLVVVTMFLRYPSPLILVFLLSLSALAGPAHAVDTTTAEPLTLLRLGEASAPAEDAAPALDVADSSRPSEVVQERYSNGKVKIRREVTQNEQQDYILHGQWTMWDEQGNETASGRYLNNERDGKWTRVHSGKDAELFATAPYKDFTAPFTSEATFKDGELDGKWIIYDQDHRKISEWEYAQGLRHGASTLNYPAGGVMQEIVFHEGLIDGYLRQYDANAKLVVDETYQQGRKVALKVAYDNAGNKKSEGIYLHAQLVLDSVDDWWNAKPAAYTTVGKDVKHGRWTAWYPNGQMRVEGTYEQDLAEGQFTWWYCNGQQAAIGNYRKGLEHGAWVWWHENGQKAVNGQYTDGEMSGDWSHWKEDGQLCEKSDFSTLDPQLVADQSEKTPEAVAPAVVQPEEAPEPIRSAVVQPKKAPTTVGPVATVPKKSRGVANKPVRMTQGPAIRPIPR